MPQELSERQKKIQALSVEDINETYKRGYMTALDKNKLMREKARATVAGSLESNGYAMAIVERSMKHVIDGWDNMKEAIVRQPTNEVKTEAYYAGLAVWGQLQIVSSVFSAFGEVTGQVAENMALKAGAPLGLARAINLAVDIGTGFLPVGTLAKSFAKTVRAVGTTEKDVAVAKTAAKAASALKDKINTDMVKAWQIFVKGLEIDGVQDAAKVMGASAEAAGQPLAHALEAGASAVKTAATLSTKEQFLSDLATFRDKMSRVTQVQSHEETAKLAEKMGLHLDDLKNVIPGQALNEKEMFAYLKALEPQVTKLSDLAKEVVATGSQEAIDALGRHASELFTVAPIFRGAEVTAGRSVEILKEIPPMKQLTNMLMGWNPEAIAKGDFNGAMKTFADDIAAAVDQPEKLAGLAVQAQSHWQRIGETYWPQARELYINLLLSRPLTQVRNVIGNGIAATNDVMDRFAGSVFSIDKQSGLVMGESTMLAKGMANGVGDGLSAFAKAYSTMSVDEVSKLDYIPHKIPGVIGRIINAPGDTMRGMDGFFKTMLKRGSYYAEALRDGTHQGLKAAELEAFVARRVNFPTQAMIESGEAFALNGTFQNELGTLGKAAQQGLQAGPLALWFPFMKTPINLAKYAWNRTPGLQLISKSLYSDILEGGARADLAIGKLTVSNLTGMYLFNLAQEGLITGSGPVDPQLKASWGAIRQPYSIKSANGWFPIQSFEPGSTTLGLMADYAQVMNQLDEPGVEQVAMAVAFSIMKNLASKSYWQTMGDLIEMTGSLTRGEPIAGQAMKIAVNPLITVATGGPLMATTTKIIDPIAREARSIVDQFTSKIPGYSKTISAKRDGYGDPFLPPQTVGSAYLGYISPLTYKPESTDRVKVEGDKLHAKLPKFPDHIGGNVKEDMDIREPQPGDKYGVQLTSKQRDRWQQIYKNILRNPDPAIGMEPALLDNSLYREQPPALQREQFQGYLSDAKKMALDALLVEDVELNKQVLTQEASSNRPLLQIPRQQQLDSAVNQATGLLESLNPEQQQNLMRWGILAPEEPAMSTP
jgi:hypothetical protein